MEYNAITTMGLCLFQDFFATEAVYRNSIGALNGPAVCSLGSLCSLLSILYFRYSSKFKASESTHVEYNFRRMRYIGLKTILFCGVLVMLGVTGIFYNTFPTTIAVYNPFKAKLWRESVTWIECIAILGSAFLILLTLVINSLVFTGPKSEAWVSMKEYATVSFSLNIMSSDNYANKAAVAPTMIFFAAIMVAFKLGNALGVSFIYLGIVVFFQMVQFFQNFRTIPYF